MFQRREITWIGLQEAQKSISNLKQEVEVAEKKLLGYKKSFYERSKSENFEIDFTSKESLENFKSKDVERFPHLNKETVFQKISRDGNKNTSGISKTFIISDEEPNFLPTKCHLVEPLEFKSEYKYSLNNFLSSSEFSLSSSGIKDSSSERTSSLFAGTYGDAGRSPKKSETKVKETITDEKESFISSIHDMSSDHKDEKIDLNKKSQSAISKDNGIEWIEAPVSRASLLQKVLRPDNFQKLKDIIDRQKKRHEEYQFQIEKKISSSSKHPDVRHLKSEKDLYHADVTKDNEVTSVPVRKVCVVKTFPFYKGFSAPSKNLLHSRQKKQKNKHTIDKPVNIRSSPKVTKRIKTVVKHKSEITSTSRSKNTDKAKDVVDKDRKHNEDDLMDEAHTESLKEISNEEKNQELNIEQGKENDLKMDIQSVLHEFQSLSKENSDENEGSMKNETFSVETKSVLSKVDIDQNSAKENTKPKKSKSIKRKSKKSPEQKVISPKIRHYDVEEVRDYIKKKKRERLKRHQEELRKKDLEAQKKKESLEKLIEYQKQNKKNTTEGKPLSPIKIHHNKDSARREHENKSENFIPEKLNTENVLVDKGKRNEMEDFPLTSIDASAVLENEELSTGGTYIKNQIHSSNSPENMQKNISVPKLISVSVPPLSVKSTEQANIVNDSSKVVSPEQSPVKKKKKVSKPKHLNKTSADLLPDKQFSKDNKTVIAAKSDNVDGFSFDILNELDNIADMNTLSEISGVGYINVKMMKENKTTKETSTGSKLNKKGELKDLVKYLKPTLEPFHRTKQWVDENPLPPKLRKTNTVEKADILKQQHHPYNEDFEFHLAHSPNETSHVHSFKEHVSGIGDVTQLHEQILGKKSTNISRPAAPPNYDDDEIIECSLSDEDYILDENQTKFENNHSPEPSNCSCHFSDLQRANVNPNPFNFINTYKRKPLGVREFTTDTTVEITNSKIPENIFLENSHSKVKHLPEANSSKSHLTESAQSASINEVLKHSPHRFVKASANDLATQRDSQNGILSEASEVASLSDHSFEDGSGDMSSKHTVISQVMSEQTIFSKDAVGTKESHASVINRANSNVKGITEPRSSNLPTSSNKDKQSTRMEDSQEKFTYNHPECLSDVILSGTMNTDFPLDVETEESVKEERQKSKTRKVDDIEQKKISASESSISEDIAESLGESSKSAEKPIKISASSKESEPSSHSKKSHHRSSGSSKKRKH